MTDHVNTDKLTVLFGGNGGSGKDFIGTAKGLGAVSLIWNWEVAGLLFS